MRVAVFYPYATGDKAFSGGVAKVIVSNIIAVKMNGDEPYLVLPEDNKGLIEFIKKNHPYCHLAPVDFMAILFYSDVKNIFKRIKLIIRSIYKYFTGKTLLRKAFKTIAPDVIHYHEIVCYNFLDCYTKARLIFHLHSYRFTSYNAIKGFFYRKINKYADVVISPTESIRKAVEGEVNNVCIIKTPYLDMGNSRVDEKMKAHFQKVKDSGKIIFSFVGRICPVKRIDHCVRALAKLSEQERDKMKYMIIGGCNTVGDQDYKKEIEAVIKNNHLESCVEFVGYVNPVETVLPFIDYGVMLTESEAMPMVGIEYLRYSIPTIGYDAPGINDYLIDEVNGFMVKNGDIDELAEKLKRAIGKDAIPAFNSTIPETYKGYSVEIFAESLKAVYAG